eukprot:1159949-Pelagomonas_calceolata.AAC.1
MKTEWQIAAGRMIAKTLSKSPRGAGLVKMDIGNDDRLMQHNLQIPAHASNRTKTPISFHVSLRDLDLHQAVLMLY